MQKESCRSHSSKGGLVVTCAVKILFLITASTELFIRFSRWKKKRIKFQVLSSSTFSARRARSISVRFSSRPWILSRSALLCARMQMHSARPYLGRESRFMARRTHSRISTRMYLRCNTYTRVKGGYAFAGRGTPAGEYLNPLAEYTGRLRAGFVPPVLRGRLRRGRAISPDRPPMGVVPSSNWDYGLRRGRCSPRAPRTRILYLPEKFSGSLDAHVCGASTVCPERIGSLLPRQLERSAARRAALLPSVNNITFQRYGRD